MSDERVDSKKLYETLIMISFGNSLKKLTHSLHSKEALPLRKLSRYIFITIQVANAPESSHRIHVQYLLMAEHGHSHPDWTTVKLMTFSKRNKKKVDNLNYCP